MIQSRHELTSPYTDELQPKGPLESTPITRPASSMAGPPESPLQVGALPDHSEAATLLPPPQASPTQLTTLSSMRMRVPLEP